MAYWGTKIRFPEIPTRNTILCFLAHVNVVAGYNQRANQYCITYYLCHVLNKRAWILHNVNSNIIQEGNKTKSIYLYRRPLITNNKFGKKQTTRSGMEECPVAMTVHYTNRVDETKGNRFTFIFSVTFYHIFDFCGFTLYST